MRIKPTSLAAAAVPVAALSLGALTLSANASTAPLAESTTTAVSAVTASTTAPQDCVRNYSPISANWSTEKGGLDIGRLIKVTSKDGVVKVRMDRVSFYRGPEAKALNGGVVPPNDYLEVNLTTTRRTFTVDPKSSIRASQALGSHPSNPPVRETITLAQFIRRAHRPANLRDAPLVWVRHTNGMSGSITAIGEQYVP